MGCFGDGAVGSLIATFPPQAAPPREIAGDGRGVRTAVRYPKKTERGYRAERAWE